jgi:hypothetical protein
MRCADSSEELPGRQLGLQTLSEVRQILVAFEADAAVVPEHQLDVLQLSPALEQANRRHLRQVQLGAFAGR